LRARQLHKIVTRDAFKGDWSKENVIRAYEAHNQNVIDSVPSDRLFVLDWSKLEGWGPLCSFLGVPEPAQPVPHVNDTAEFQAMTNRIAWGGLIVGALGLGIPFLMAAPASPSPSLPPPAEPAQQPST
jgi:hypothetical protein